MSRFAKHIVCVLAVFSVMAVVAAPLQAGTILQWGFDYTSGTLASNGLPVADDSGAGHPGTTVLYTPAGGTYSSDIPNAANRQFTTGIGSLDFTGTNAALSTAASAGVGSGQGIISASDIYNAGGLTAEVWMKNASVASGATTGDALLVNGMYGLGVRNGKIGYYPAAGDAIEVAQSTSDWTHLAVVFSGPNATCTAYANVTAYVNGEAIGTTLNATLPWFLNRATSVGNHQYGDWDNYEGLVYEPRISLGALTPAQFEYKAVPEPSTLVVFAMGISGLVAYAWRRRK